MSLTIYVHFEKNIAVETKARDWILLARYWERLDEVAKEHSLRPISDYFSFDQNDLPDDLDLVGLEEFPIPAVQWFDASQVATTADRLISVLEHEPSAFAGMKIQDHLEDLVVELRDVKQLADAASMAASKIRLTIGE